MSKTKKNSEIDFQLVQIEQTGFSLNIPEGFKTVQGFQFRVSLESFINAEKKRLVVTNRIDVRDGSDTPILGHLIAKYHFDLIGIEHIKQNKKGKHLIPDELQLSVNTIALSTTRGLMFAQFKGTILQGAVLPVIDPANFSVNEAED
ncbi:hypothetical protein [Mucilaginibacter segetis]|uniref:Uncharacterized protein n=1 Tax=Mucilaginibacter segetis TaxID=2793071 RepID=A0A934UMW6_9SPHI|nr:hypothetical protein [Mucilaginibacter segetis]MBK0379296.1 hypothetical protein [Mucilaginibacter segetis]